MYKYFVPNDVNYLLHRNRLGKPYFRKVKVKCIFRDGEEVICFNGKDNIIRYRKGITTAHRLCNSQKEANEYARSVIQTEIDILSHKVNVLQLILK